MWSFSDQLLIKLLQAGSGAPLIKRVYNILKDR